MENKIKSKIMLLILGLFPVLMVAIRCMREGNLIGDIYLPNSLWNDELYYFKQVEGAVKYNVPQGYFGYNESHAEYFTFGAWSPLLSVFWILWGKIFGWTYLSPIICNITLFTFAMVVFALLVKPNIKQASLLSIMIMLFTPVVRWMCSCTPEIICISLAIIMYSFCLKMKQCCGVGLGLPIVAVTFLIGVFLTLMRPYYVLLLLIPMWYWYKSSKKKFIFVISGGIIICSIILSLLISAKFCAPYFTPLIKVDWFKLLFEDFGQGILNIGKIFLDSVYTYLQTAGKGITNGDDIVGSWFAVFLCIVLWLTMKSVEDFKTKKDESEIADLYWAGYFIILFFAISYLYDLRIGSRHLLAFIVLGIFLISLNECRSNILIFFLIMFIWVFNVKGLDEYSYGLPISTDEMKLELSEIESCLDDAIKVDTESNAWDNTVIWVGSDSKIVKWQELYAFPSGLGINLCTWQYVTENFSELKSRYLFTSIGGEVDLLCAQSGKKLLVEYGESHVWELR